MPRSCGKLVLPPAHGLTPDYMEVLVMAASPELWFFEKFALHKRLPERAQQELDRVGVVERWGHTARIHHPPQASDKVFVIVQGGVILRDTPGAEPVTLRVGDLFGALTDSELDLEATIARDQTQLIGISRADFDQIAAPLLGDNDARPRRLARRASSISAPARAQLYTTPSARLAKVLLHLAETQGEVTDSVAKLGFVARSRALAKLTSLPEARVSKLLAAWRTRALFDASGEVTALRDLETLRELARGH